MPSGPTRSSVLALRPAPPPADDELEIGTISGVFGVMGEVRLFLHNPESVALVDPTVVVLVRPDGARFEATLQARSGAGKRIIGRIRGLDDRNVAHSLKDWRVLVRGVDLPEPEPDEFYVRELEGLVVFAGDREMGSLTAVHPTPGGDVLEIDTGAAEPAFVPFVERYVLEVDLEGGRVVLTDDAFDEGEA
jgi:16S rRNA processing protein RimM